MVFQDMKLTLITVFAALLFAGKKTSTSTKYTDHLQQVEDYV